MESSWSPRFGQKKSIDIRAVILRGGYGFSFSVRTFKEAIVQRFNL